MIRVIRSMLSMLKSMLSRALDAATVVKWHVESSESAAAAAAESGTACKHTGGCGPWLLQSQ